MQLLAGSDPGSWIGRHCRSANGNASARNLADSPVGRMPGTVAQIGIRVILPSMSTATPPATDLRLVVGFDGSPPSSRALDAAVNLLQGRIGRIEVVYVAHMPSMAALSPAAVAELETDFDDVEQELRTMAGAQLGDRVEGWGFERRQGLIAEELLAAAKDIGAAHPDATVVIVVGSSSLAAHRVVGSVAVRPGPPLTGAPDSRALAGRDANHLDPVRPAHPGWGQARCCSEGGKRRAGGGECIRDCTRYNPHPQT